MAKAKTEDVKTETAQATPSASEFDALQNDMIDIARKMCAEISDGSARDYYQHIDSIIKLHNAVRPTSVPCLA